MPCRKVIHAVGPVYRDGQHGEPVLLASCYKTCISLAEHAGLHTIAFPCISTGVYGYPKQEAAEVVKQVLTDYFASCTATGKEPLEVTLCCFESHDAKVYEEIFNC